MEYQLANVLRRDTGECEDEFEGRSTTLWSYADYGDWRPLASYITNTLGIFVAVGKNDQKLFVNVGSSRNLTEVIAVVWCSSRVIIACDWAVLLLGHGILIDVMLEVLFVITTSTAATKQQEMWKQVIVQKWDLLYDRYTGLKYYYCYVHESTAHSLCKVLAPNIKELAGCDPKYAEKIKVPLAGFESTASVNSITSRT
ncbi:hypothetical protein Tco_0586655 [Tanacetum coccineum]